jgi:hypothetical protein
MQTGVLKQLLAPRTVHGGVGMPARKPDLEGEASVAVVAAVLDRGDEPERGALRAAARFLLHELERVSPGRSVEIRVVPVAAVQAVAGPRHTRGTPPNVVETDPLTWFKLATGRLNWDEALRSGAVQASGARSDLSAFLPLT